MFQMYNKVYIYVYIYVYVYIFFRFISILDYNIEYSSLYSIEILCYMVGLHCLYISCVYLSTPKSQFIPPLLIPPSHLIVF